MDLAIRRRLRCLTWRGRVVLLLCLLLLVAGCFLAEWTGVSDRLLQWAGVQDTCVRPEEGAIAVHVLDVGNADAMVVFCEQQTMLIDAGQPADGRTIVAYLQQYGVTALDYVVITHADTDHIGGMQTVLEQFPVGECLLSLKQEDVEGTSAWYDAVLDTLSKNRIPIRDVTVGNEYPFGTATLEILGPITETGDVNDQSVVCRLIHGDTRFLFTGDAGSQAEWALMRDHADLSADFLKVGHHGSSDSSTQAFLNAVDADVYVISCGADNLYGHPHAETLSRLHRAGGTLYRTDECGTVIVTGDGKRLSVQTGRE